MMELEENTPKTIDRSNSSFMKLFLSKKDAMKDELFFKSGYGREVLKDKLKNYLQSKDI